MTSSPKADGPAKVSSEALKLMQELRDQQEPIEEFTGAVLFCCVCSSVVDATSWGVRRYECNSCTTVFEVDLRPEVVAEHSMYGAISIHLALAAASVMGVISCLL